MRHALKLDDAGMHRLEAIYLCPEMVSQRCEIVERLNLKAGEHVLDIGCGPGFLAAEIAREVGPTGQVRGIDYSQPVLEMARRRCADLEGTSFEGAFASELPYVNERFDVGVASQVYGYLHDVEHALAELYRVLRPGGRALILETDWGSLVWHAANQERMRRVLSAWNQHETHPDLPRRLSPMLLRAGFKIEERTVFPLFNPEFSEQAYCHGLIDAIRSFVPGRERLGEAEVETWEQEQRDLGRNGEFFFSVNRYLFLISRPDLVTHIGPGVR
jgi:ubiquinone/menaquinone biosynthesis C-methylase UbiE